MEQNAMENLPEYINKLRHDFAKMSLDESMVDPDPLKQFDKWFHDAVSGKVDEPNAMVLSTVNSENRPSSRVLLMRNYDAQGFGFYTNYKSRKAQEIANYPNASLLFFWPQLERQIRIEGMLEKQLAEESDTYFNSRPRESQLGAWTSPQSEIIADRKFLEEELAEITKKFEGKEVPRPEWWGGFVLVPDRMEFWQGRPGRLHDRICYVKENNGWKIVRLAP